MVLVHDIFDRGFVRKLVDHYRNHVSEGVLVAGQASSSLSSSATSAQAVSLFMSKFGNLLVGRGGGETDMGVEAGRTSGETDAVFNSMDVECKVCRQEIKVRHQVEYSVDDLYVD